MATLLDSPVNVKSLGAIGDGTTDDTAAFTAALATGASMYVPKGTYKITSGLSLAAGALVLGDGPGKSIINFTSTTTKLFTALNDKVAIRGLRLVQVGVATSGNAGIYSAGNGSLVTSALCNNAAFEDLELSGFYDGIYLAGSGGSIDLTRINASNCTHDGLVALSAQGYWYGVLAISNTRNGVTIGKSAGSGGATPFIEGAQTYNNGGWGLYATCTVQIGGQCSFFNNDYLGEVYVNYPVGSSVDNGYIDNAYVQFAGASVSWGTTNTAPGILVDTGSGPISISNCHLLDTQGNGISLKSATNSVIGCRIIACGQGAQASNLYGIKIDSATGDEIISGNMLTNGINRFDGIDNIITDNFFGGSSASPLAYFSSGTDSIFDGNQLQQAGAGTAYTIDAGVSVADGVNELTSSTSFTNNGSRSSRGQRLVPFREHTYGAAVTSATSIAPTGEIFHVTGTTTVQTITVPSGMSYPRVCIISDSALPFGTSGNIINGFTATAGAANWFQYDVNTTKWYH